MRHRRIPGTDLFVSEVGFPVGAPRSSDAARLLERAFDRQITFFDVADIEGAGEAEKLLSRALREHRRELTIATKGGYDFVGSTGPARFSESGAEPPQDWRASSLQRSCEASLRRLETDVIDLYLLHHPRIEILERDAVWEILERLRKEGKIREYGIALGPGAGWEEEARCCLGRRGNRAVQMVHNLLQQEPVRSIAADAASVGCVLIAREPRARGMLGGRLAGGPFGPPGGSFPRTAGSPEEEGSASQAEKAQAGREMVESLRFLQDGRSLEQAAILSALARPAMVATLPHMTGPDELDELALAGELDPLSQEEIFRIEEIWQERGGVSTGPLGSSARLRTPHGTLRD